MHEILEHSFYLGTFTLLVLCGLGIPIPEDLTLITCGYMVAREYGHFGPLIPTAIAGVVIGDVLLFEIGRRYGKKVEKWPILGRFLTDARLEWARDKYRRYGGRMIFASRFAAGMRAAFHVAAGMLDVPLWKFILYDGLASLLSVPVLIWLGWYFADDLDRLIRFEHRSQIVIMSILGAILVIGLLLRWRTLGKIEHPDPPADKSP